MGGPYVSGKGRGRQVRRTASITTHMQTHKEGAIP